MIKLVLISLLFSVVACKNGAETPEGLIKMFVKDTISGKVDREYYQEYTTGTLLEASLELTEEELEKTSVSKLKNVKVSILSKNCSNEKCIITYIIKYDTNPENKKMYKTEVKKLAEVVKEGEGWKLSDIKNLKTFHDSLEPINPLED